ncbi:hypothetical protein ACLOJK_021982 [Asimina triloba]
MVMLTQPATCYNGIRYLNGATKMTPDRQTACNCLKSVAGSIKGFKINLATGLLGKCGASVPYKIAPSTDCSQVRRGGEEELLLLLA